MTSPENIKSLLATVRGMPGPGIPICSEAKGPTSRGPVCSARTIAIAAVAAHNEKAQSSPRVEVVGRPMKPPVLIDPTRAAFKFNVSKGEDSGDKPWHDIKHLSLRYGNEPVPLVEFDISALPDNPAAEYITTRPLMIETSSIQRQVAFWMGDCHENHSACVPAAATPLPTRVLHVGQAGLGSDTVRIYETHGEWGMYAALSYCWGGHQPVMLLRDTHESMTTGFDRTTLPQTLQDAVQVTRELGLRYLWIDALCIIQDSQKDKEQELKMMSGIYKNAYITLAASSASTCRQGFLQNRAPRKSKYPRFELPYRAWVDESTMGTVIIEESFHHDAFQDPINRRAWCLQERLLSPRIIMFGTHELSWQCQNGQRIAGGTGRSFLAGSERLHPAVFDQTKSITEEDFYDSWIDVVVDYSQRDISFESDKLVAMAAIASEFQRLSNEDIYVTGMWKRDLIKWLSWVVDPSHLEPFGPRRLQPRPTRYVAPTWTWASVHGTVAFCCNWREKGFYAEVLRCEVTLLNKGLPTAEVTAGELEIRAPVKVTRWAGQTLFRGQDAGPEALGKAFMDADEHIPEVVYCVRLYKDSGIIVVKKENSSDVYKRVGRFEIWNASAGEEWFEDSEAHVIILH